MILQLPNIEINDALPLTEQIKQIKESLTDMNEKLTFMLSEIDTDNLSEHLLALLKSGNVTESAPTVDLTPYLKKSEASTNYLTKTEAQNIYLTQAQASYTYCTMENFNVWVSAIINLINSYHPS